MLPITLRRLQVFVAVVESRSFGAAAASLGISQPSVSVHMRTLESQVGTALFERQPGTAPQLTEAGRTLYGYAQDTLQRASAVSVELGQHRRKLRFASQRFVSNALLAQTFASFSSAFPQVEVIARTGTFEEVQALYQSGAVDLAFMLSAAHDLPDWQTGAMGRYRLAFIAAPGHALARQCGIARAELALQPFIAAYRGSHFGRTIEDLMARAGLSMTHTVAQAQEAGTVRDMVKAGMGIACTLRRSVQAELAAGTLIELDVEADPMYLVLGYARNPKAEMAEIDSLIAMVRQSDQQSCAPLP